MIRTAEETDIPRIVELGMQSLLDGPYAGIIKQNPKKAAESALRVIQAANGKILLYLNDAAVIVGVLAFVIYPEIFTGEDTAHELMWYVLPDERKGGAGTKLLWAAENLAKSLGAVWMGVTSPSPDVSAIYKRFGYNPMETAYLKRLTCHS